MQQEQQPILSSLCCVNRVEDKRETLNVPDQSYKDSTFCSDPYNGKPLDHAYKTQTANNIHDLL